MVTPFRAVVSALTVSALVGLSAPAAALPFSTPQLTSSVPGQAEGYAFGAAPIVHDGAPVPSPFTADWAVGYISDRSAHGLGTYHQVVASFTDLRAAHPEIMDQNLEMTVAVNNTAAQDPALIARAQLDAAADEAGVMYAVSDALGAEFGQAFRDALGEKRLPKLEFLLGNGYAARAGGLASSTWIEKEVFGFERPFVVAPDRIHRYELAGHDFYGTSKSFPSGHTNQAAWITTLLGMMLPEVGPQLLARGSESGYHRIVLGVHYPLDVIGGRKTGIAAAADRWNDPKMRDALTQAADELRAEIEWRTGRSIADLAAADDHLTDAAAVAAYTERMSYGFPTVAAPDAPMIVPQAAPDLLLAHFPELSYEQRRSILAQTALPAGRPLDDQGAGGSWQRLNLAAAWAAEVTVLADGSVSVG